MKKLSIALAVAAASMFVSGQASAQAYVSGHLGLSKVNVDCGGNNNCDTGDLAYQLTAGYSFNRNLAVEFGYVSYGEASGLGRDWEVTAFKLGAAYALPVAKKVDLIGRLGLARVTTDVSGGIGSKSKIRPYFGFGATYAFTKNLKAEASAELVRFTPPDTTPPTSSGSALGFTVGMRYTF